MSIMRIAADEYFWDKWEEKFLSGIDEYITPTAKPVKAAVANAGICEECPKEKVAKDVWEYVHSVVGYKLSEEWKTPEQTLKEGKGDCEDVSFLAASMLIRSGISGFDFVIGYMDKTDNGEKHTWLEVGDLVVDPTTGVGENGDIEYTAEKKFELRVDND